MTPTTFESLTTAIGTGFTTIGTQIGSVALVVIPAGLGVLALVLGIKYAKKFFGAISK